MPISIIFIGNYLTIHPIICTARIKSHLRALQDNKVLFGQLKALRCLSRFVAQLTWLLKISLVRVICLGSNWIAYSELNMLSSLSPMSSANLKVDAWTRNYLLTYRKHSKQPTHAHTRTHKVPWGERRRRKLGRKGNPNIVIKHNGRAHAHMPPMLHLPIM